jgi:hypothetical protein
MYELTPQFIHTHIQLAGQLSGRDEASRFVRLKALTH